ncbi:hypothetical protein CIG2463D_1379 [Campylobacter iguaniorum]|uniref:hypothetical protein n=1 Tax=Campylobacter iguaniorum TaxID=1244531 RepID=UPI00073A2E39|nr:hypothetical protein [Campylobacter iguaniorum]ALV24947.1 hypothetical protein CIG2463D_1379 [Campylobacter iguaniorum]
MQDDNLIKQTCKELNLTYKQLGELIGMSEGGLKTAITKGNISEQTKQAISLLKENMQLKQELNKTNDLKNLLNNFLKS